VIERSRRNRSSGFEILHAGDLSKCDLSVDDDGGLRARGDARGNELLLSGSHGRSGRRWYQHEITILGAAQGVTRVSDDSFGMNVLLLVATALLFAAPAQDGAQSPFGDLAPTPKQIFVQGFHRLLSYPTPAYAVEIDAAVTTINSSIATNPSGTYYHLYRYAFRAVDGMVNSVLLPKTGGFSKLPDAVIKPAWDGAFAWSGTWGKPRESDTNQGPELPQGLKVIASVTTYNPDYVIELLGTEELDGHQAYHLRLTPLHDPVRHNLRELWIDIVTYDIWKAKYIAAPRDSGPTLVTASFGPATAFWILQKVSWGDPNASPVGQTTEITTRSTIFVPTLPSWLFDPQAYASQQRAGEADYLGQLLEP
jgi:hypothetical protein